MEENRKRRLAILGSTGSIGTQTLQVVDEHPECFEVYAITAGSRVDDLIAQARKFMPEAAVIAATNSSLREGDNVAVDYTEIRNIRKPSGAKPGMVVYETYHTAYVDPDTELCKRLKNKNCD